ncbi:hypothetical protein ALC53_13976, partial [Atta colombica]
AYCKTIVGVFEMLLAFVFRINDKFGNLRKFNNTLRVNVIKLRLVLQALLTKIGPRLTVFNNILSKVYIIKHLTTTLFKRNEYIYTWCRCTNPG